MLSEPSAHPLEPRLREEVAAGLPAAIAQLGALVRIPSVSWDGFDPDHVVASAEAVAEAARGLGVFDTVEVVRERIPEGVSGAGELGLPAVIATRAPKNGRPTVLLYAHHDVQPPGDPNLWLSEPFEPTLRGDRIFGRGAADDKAGLVSHVASIRALTEVLGREPDLGLVLFAEGEEEFASRSFSALLETYADRLKSDVIIVADSGNWDTETPALTVGLRGMVAFNLRVSTLDHALHSGMFGGAVPDAMMATTQLLNTLWNADGSVAVEGLTSYDGPTPEYDEARLREEAAPLPGTSPIGTGTILSRVWNQPSITVTGIDAPSVKDASNTLLPTVRVRLAARIAPGQKAADARAAILAHLEKHVPHGAVLETDGLDTGEAFLVDAGGWAAEDALAGMHEAWGVEPVQMGVGGSIPFIAELDERFPGTQILVTGVEDPDSRAHSPNESLHVPSFERAILSQALLLARLEDRDLRAGE